MTAYPIVEIDNLLEEMPESLGTKEKFWVKRNGVLSLVKFGREGTGENWAEKVACELCSLLGIDHAHYDLATLQKRECVITPMFVPRDGRLIFGNELINHLIRRYDGSLMYRQKEHTITRVSAAIGTFAVGASYSGRGLFLGYLLLDAWIGNTDRHHENWGLIIDRERRVRLAPSFDHASSLGRELTDQDRIKRLSTNDARNNVAAYARRARSALYSTPNDPRSLTTLDAFCEMGRRNKTAARMWIGRLENISEDDVKTIFERVPDRFITKCAGTFAKEMLKINKAAILQARELIG